MKPADQLILHDPDNKKYGDCYRAVIASLMEMKTEQVPHFADGPAPSDWKKKTNLWLAGRGLAYMTIRSRGWKWEDLFPGAAGIYHEICGPSPRFHGSLHCVVGLDGEIIHDPHPSKKGIIDVKSEWTYGLIITLNAGKNRQI